MNNISLVFTLEMEIWWYWKASTNWTTWKNVMMSEFWIEGCSFLISLRIDCIRTDWHNMKNKKSGQSKCNGIFSTASAMESGQSRASGTLSVQYSWFIVVLAGNYIVMQKLAGRYWTWPVHSGNCTNYLQHNLVDVRKAYVPLYPPDKNCSRKFLRCSKRFSFGVIRFWWSHAILFCGPLWTLCTFNSMSPGPEAG